MVGLVVSFNFSNVRKYFIQQYQLLIHPDEVYAQEQMETTKNSLRETRKRLLSSKSNSFLIFMFSSKA